MRQWRTASAMSGSDVSVSSPPWRMRPSARSRLWRISTKAICSKIRCSPPAPCRASMSSAPRWQSAVPGHFRSRINMAPMPSISRSTRVWRRRRKVLLSTLIGLCMSTAPLKFREEELLANVIARLIGDVRHVAVGNASPIPATAALLARERGAGRPYVSLLQSRKHNFWTDGARELFDCAGQGRIDVFFLSGGQIDGQGNVNLVSTGDYARPKVRFPGSFGSAYLYYVVPKVILFRTEHSRRTLVPKVDFISAPGSSNPTVFRPGGPIALVTNRCLFSFMDGRFALASVP